MGSWDRPAHAQLDSEHLDWLRTVPSTRVFRDQVFLCHATPADDDVYWLETVMPDGSVRMSPLEAIEKEAEGISQSLILCAHTHIARAVRLRDGRLVVNPGSVGVPGFSYNVPFPHVIEAGTPDARYAILELADASWRVTFRHVPYDHDAMAALARRNGDAEFASALATGWIAERRSARMRLTAAQSGRIVPRTDPGLRFAAPGLRDHPSQNKTAGYSPAVSQSVNRNPIRPQR